MIAVIRFLFILSAVAASLLFLARITLELTALANIFQPADSPSAKVAIVFGAGLTRDGRPTPVLRDRVETAANLYFAGKVEKLLMSGDNRFISYNEPAAMRAYALELGVPDQAIVLDFAGRRTYDTCYRAKAIFGVREAILVTQRFHLARALFTCANMGIKSSGVVANQRVYGTRSRVIWQMRETSAAFVALLDVYITHPLPVLGSPEPIFPEDTFALKP